MWNLKSGGNKTELVYRSFLFLKDCSDRGLDMFRKMNANAHFLSYSKFLQSQGLAATEWTQPPSISCMRDVLSKAGDKFGTGNRPLTVSEWREKCEDRTERVQSNEEEAPSTPNFSMSEFSRLIVLMRDDEAVRMSFVGHFGLA